MGIIKRDLIFIKYCQLSGVDFSVTATLGRQTLYMSRPELSDIWNLIFPGISEEKVDEIFDTKEKLDFPFGETIFTLLGATEIDSYDYSSYEGANCIIDLNKPIEKEHYNRYSVVFDGGTLEHIFNFPQALTNVVNLLKPGGFFISISPANNYFGHGMYQFSPEVFYSSLNESIGMRNTKVFINGSDDSFYYVLPVYKTKVRGELNDTNNVKTSNFVISQKSWSECYHSEIYQEDYELVWNGISSTDLTQDWKLRFLPLTDHPAYRAIELKRYLSMMNPGIRDECTAGKKEVV